jgi:cytochrome d ubiquinol oxidase subunit I
MLFAAGVETSSELVAARSQMALSLGFHIVLSCFGVAFPTLIYLVHRRGLRGDADALVLARRWSKVAAVLFAVGAVSGTVLSFEMGLLWPGLMSRFGDVIGLPFAMEGIAFFVEAVFLGIYLYGWDRLPPRVHLATLVPIMVSGLVGTFCILAVNAWMNAPSGFRIVDGEVVDIDPLAAIFNGALWPQFLHMFVAAYMVTGFCVAAVMASGLRKGRRDHLHRLGLRTALTVATVAAVVQPFIGHVAGMRLATEQPAKLAAMELATETETHAPIIIGGLLVDGEVRWGLEIPGLGSLIARGATDRPITGLDDIAVDDRPPANVVHLSFQLMVGIGTALAGLGALLAWRRRRGHDPSDSPWALRALVWSGPLAVLALQAGWTTTEVGRQPWIVHDVLRVRDAVTPNGGIWISFTVVAVLYLALGIGTVAILRSMSARWRHHADADLPTPYGPPDGPGARSDADVLAR